MVTKISHEGNKTEANQSTIKPLAKYEYAHPQPTNIIQKSAETEQKSIPIEANRETTMKVPENASLQQQISRIPFKTNVLWFFPFSILLSSCSEISSQNPFLPLCYHPPAAASLILQTLRKTSSLSPKSLLSHTLLGASTNGLQDSITGVPFSLLLNSTTLIPSSHPRVDKWPYGIVTLGKIGCMKVSL